MTTVQFSLLQNSFKRAFIGLVVTVQVFAFPAGVFAQTVEGSSGDSVASQTETTEPTQETQSTPPPPTTGPTSPTGADSVEYVKNDETGQWESDKYIWDPITGKTQPKTAPSYSYNPETGMWDTIEYVYHPESGTYEPNVVSKAVAPMTTATGAPASSAQNSISNTGPNSNNTINSDDTTNAYFNLFFNAAISNTVNSSATSGDALVQGNTKAGSALSGDAQTLANVVNMLQSAWLDQGSDVAGFVANVDGSVVGDLYIDPNALSDTTLAPNADIDINISANAAINNDINLTATSGDATVNGNTEAGNARTGDANVVANLVNMMNSSITAGQSFMGVLNINGNLDGDILLPQYLLDSVIAGTGPSSSNTISNSQDNIIDVEVDKNQTILNNVVATAETGDALVGNNTSAGSAESGEAKTSTNTINLVGQDYKGKNGLLVFINVAGKWLGMSVKPLGAGITNTGPNSNNTITSDGERSISVDAEENSLISNNVNVAARSGDASVTGNTQAGDATSGDAHAAVNILNMMDSSIDVSDWFGVLFINVFGTWDGSFGMDTSSGDRVNPSPTVNETGQVFAFNPGAASETEKTHQSNGGQNSYTESSVLASGTTTTSDTGTTSGVAAKVAIKDGVIVQSEPADSTGRAWRGNIMVSLLATIIASAILFGERILAFARQRLIVSHS